jgi:hypothetical protein
MLRRNIATVSRGANHSTSAVVSSLNWTLHILRETIGVVVHILIKLTGTLNSTAGRRLSDLHSWAKSVF